MTLLYKEKINKITGESEIQYDRLSDRKMKLTDI
jgi:hypothetical protein